METITINGVEYIKKEEALARLPEITMESAPYQIGANYFIRTVTHSYTGKLVWVGSQEIVLENPAWIADSGRFMQAIRNGKLHEVEPMNPRVVIGRGAIVDASVVTWELPTEQK